MAFENAKHFIIHNATFITSSVAYLSQSATALPGTITIQIDETPTIPIPATATPIPATPTTTRGIALDSKAPPPATATATPATATPPPTTTTTRGIALDSKAPPSATSPAEQVHHCTCFNPSNHAIPPKPPVVIPGLIKVDGLRYRRGPRTTFDAVGQYPIGTKISIVSYTQTNTTVVHGDPRWAKLTNGYWVALAGGRYVSWEVAIPLNESM